MRQTKIVLFLFLGIVLCTILLTPTEGVAKKAFLSEDEYLNLPEEKMDIAEGALIIAKGFYPDLDIQKYLDQIDGMVAGLKPKLKGVKKPEKIIAIINDDVLVKQKLQYKEGATFLNDLLDKGHGNCVSLSTLYLCVTQRLNLPFYGVHAPTHNFVRYDDGKTRLNVEITAGGAVRPDEYYMDLNERTIHPVSIKNGTYLRNLTKKELCSAIISNRGDLLREKQSYHTALSDCKTAIHLDSKNLLAYNTRAIIYKALCKYQEAIRDLDKTIGLDPNNAAAYNNRGVIHEKLGKHEEAINDYTKAVELDPNYVTAYYNRAKAYHHLKDFQQAINDYTKVVELEPTHAHAYYRRGNAYGSLKNYQQAVSNYTKAIALKPKTSLTAYVQRGLTYKKKGDYQRAVNDFTRAIELNPKYEQAYFYRGLVYGNNLHNHQGAVDDFTTLIELNPKNTSAYNHRGNAFGRLGKYQEAIKDYTNVIELNPKVGIVYSGRAFCHAKLGNRQQAFSDYKAAAKLGHKGAQAFLKKQGIQW